MRIAAAILSFIILVWTPAGKLYMLWFEFFRGENFIKVIKTYEFKMELLKSGLLGLFTAHFNKKWRSNAPAHKKVITQPAKELQLDF